MSCRAEQTRLVSDGRALEGDEVLGDVAWGANSVVLTATRRALVSHSEVTHTDKQQFEGPLQWFPSSLTTEEGHSSEHYDSDNSRA